MTGENSFPNYNHRLQFLFIFDGYDEVNKNINIFNVNNLWIYYKVKVIISARKEYIISFPYYLELFSPLNSKKEFEEIEEIYIQNLDDN